MGFSNWLREQDDRTIRKRRFTGYVVKNEFDNDQNHAVSVRVHDLHDNIQDEDLPLFRPMTSPGYTSSADAGHHGPIPPVGSKIWVEFTDDSQYHGVYHGAVTTTDNRLPDFTGSGKYAKDYPHANGHVNDSGTLHAVSHVRDTEEHTHVSGTSIKTDGVGNMSAVINGDAKRPDNPKAQKAFPKGFSSTIFGDLTLYVSGQVNIAAGGNANVVANGSAFVSAKQNLNLSAGQTLALQGASITASVEIVQAGGKAPATVQSQTAPTPRSRPQPTVNANPSTY